MFFVFIFVISPWRSISTHSARGWTSRAKSHTFRLRCVCRSIRVPLDFSLFCFFPYVFFFSFFLFGCSQTPRVCRKDVTEPPPHFHISPNGGKKEIVKGRGEWRCKIDRLSFCLWVSCVCFVFVFGVLVHVIPCPSRWKLPRILAFAFIYIYFGKYLVDD